MVFGQPIPENCAFIPEHEEGELYGGGGVCLKVDDGEAGDDATWSGIFE